VTFYTAPAEARSLSVEYQPGNLWERGLHILIGVCLALAALYFWLIGHWFARVVAFLSFGALLGLIGSGLTGSMGPPEHNHGWVGILCGVALAWPVSGIPIYFYRWRSHVR
jgi:hypothetical protein